MEILYADSRVKQICTEQKVTRKFFGGNLDLEKSLYARLYSLSCCDSLYDAYTRHNYFRIHKLYNIGGRDYSGCLAMDVKTRKEPWRLIFKPLNDKRQPVGTINLPTDAKYIEIIEIIEVSKHYE